MVSKEHYLKYEEKLRKLDGLHTVDTIMETLSIKKQSAINLITLMRKNQNLTVWARGNGKKKIYKITMRKQRPRCNGMFDVLNKYSPMKLSPWYDHQVHGTYGPEEALIDAIQTESFRVILASLRLFAHIKDWKKVYKLANEKDCWQKVGALYDVARLHFKIRRMKLADLHNKFKKKINLINKYPTKEEIYLPIEKKWKVSIPFRIGDIMKVKYDYT